MKYRIGEEWFKTKDQIKGRARTILNGTPLNQRLAGEEFDFVRHLLNRHPWADEKVGDGVEAISVRHNVTRHFCVHRTDGTVVDFSYQKCITPPTHRTQVRGCFRWAVAHQLRDFKNTVFSTLGEPFPCPLSETPVYRETSHVDHVIPFATIIERYLGERGLSEDTITIEERAHPTLGYQLADKRMESDWAAYHQELAVMRVVDAKANEARRYDPDAWRVALDSIVAMEADGFAFRAGEDGKLVVRPGERIAAEQADILRTHRDLFLEILRWRSWRDKTDAMVLEQSSAGLFDGVGK